MTETFQITAEQAEAYEARFVPAVFQQWAPLLADAAGITAGQSVLDVACGTGVVAREVAGRLHGTGRVRGLDLNAAMLAVAERLAPGIEWHQGDAEALPFPDEEFDVVLCQSALMFFGRPAAALAEMARVVRATGVVGLQVYDTLGNQPAYRRLVDVAVRHAGSAAAGALGVYWTHGDLEALGRTLREAGLRPTAVSTHTGTAQFASVDEVVQVEIGGTPLGGRITPSTYTAIRDDARLDLAQFTDATGRAVLPIRSHLVVTTRDRS